jgi:hypothetical protein
MAQLVAHHTGSVGVRGSSPLSSTETPQFRPGIRTGSDFLIEASGPALTQRAVSGTANRSPRRTRTWPAPRPSDPRRRPGCKPRSLCERLAVPGGDRGCRDARVRRQLPTTSERVFFCGELHRQGFEHIGGLPVAHSSLAQPLLDCLAGRLQISKCGNRWILTSVCQ